MVLNISPPASGFRDMAALALAAAGIDPKQYVRRRLGDPLCTADDIAARDD